MFQFFKNLYARLFNYEVVEGQQILDNIKVAITDVTKKQLEGRKVFYDLFLEVTEAHNKNILEFLASYKPPSFEELEFMDKCNLRVSSDDGHYIEFERAKSFKRLQEKYGHVVTNTGLNKFGAALRDQYSLNVERKSLYTIKPLVTPETLRDMMAASSKIDMDDTSIFIQYSGGYRYGTDIYNLCTPRYNRKYADLLTLPPSIYGETFKLTQEQFNVVTEKFGSNNVKSASRGNFIILREGSDPIILAELTDECYLVVSHMPESPKESGFSV